MAKKNNEESSSLTFDLLRVEPQKIEIKNNPKNDRLTDLLAILFIFGIAMFVRIYTRSLFLSKYSEDAFNFQILKGDPFGIGKYLGLKPGGTVYIEGYYDFPFYYVPYVNAFLKGWNPYSGSIVPGDHIGGYVYGPFYIYFISIGKAWFNLSSYNSILYSNMIFDSLCFVMVYILAKRVTGNVIAMIFAVVGSMSPISLYYANIKALNAPSMTFFTLVFIYYFLEKKDKTAIFFLAIATLNKQIPIFIIMPLGFWLVRRHGFLKGTAYFLFYFFAGLLLSIPWVLYNPRFYFGRMLVPGLGSTAIKCPSGSEATTLVDGPLVNICAKNTFPNNVIPLNLVPSTSLFLYKLVNFQILFFVSLFILAWIGFTGYDYLEKNPKLYYRFFAAYFFIAHATLARGIYKYYTTMLIPLMILAFIPGNTNKSLNIQLGASLNQSLSTYLNPKNRIKPANLSYWTGFSIVIFCFYGVFWLLKASISMFIKSTNYQIIYLIFIVPIALYCIYRPNKENVTNNLQEVKFGKLLVVDILYLILLIPTGYFLLKLGKLYFEGYESNIINYSIMFGIIALAFFSLPYLQKWAFRDQIIFQSKIFNFEQFIFDIIGFIIAFIVINTFNIQIITVDRFLTSAVVLVFGLFIVGLFGRELLISSIVVPKNAWTSYQKLRRDKYLIISNKVKASDI